MHGNYILVFQISRFSVNKKHMRKFCLFKMQKCKAAIKTLFLYFNLSVMFDSLSRSFTSISFLIN